MSQTTFSSHWIERFERPGHGLMPQVWRSRPNRGQPGALAASGQQSSIAAACEVPKMVAKGAERRRSAATLSPALVVIPVLCGPEALTKQIANLAREKQLKKAVEVFKKFEPPESNGVMICPDGVVMTMRVVSQEPNSQRTHHASPKWHKWIYGMPYSLRCIGNRLVHDRQETRDISRYFKSNYYVYNYIIQHLSFGRLFEQQWLAASSPQYRVRRFYPFEGFGRPGGSGD